MQKTYVESTFVDLVRLLGVRMTAERRRGLLDCSISISHLNAISGLSVVYHLEHRLLHGHHQSFRLVLGVRRETTLSF